MCVQYRGGDQYCGGVQYHGGYHDACGGYLGYHEGCSASWGDIIINVGDILNTVEEYQEYCGGYLK